VRPELVRSGGSLPILAALEQRSIPTLISGIDLPEGNAHGPNERPCLANLDLGLAAARELFLAWGAFDRAFAEPRPARTTVASALAVSIEVDAIFDLR
jgi:hypothetical protein